MSFVLGIKGGGLVNREQGGSCAPGCREEIKGELKSLILALGIFVELWGGQALEQFPQTVETMADSIYASCG
jgi:hypothetical protein